MSKINAKQELLEEIEYYNLEILKIDCVYRDFNKNIKTSCKTLESLDFYYEEWETRLSLSGNVYCIDKSGNIVWLERVYYERGSWYLIEVPTYVKEFIINNNKK